MELLNVLAAISLVTLVTVMFGGYSLLRLLNAGDKLSGFQINQFRAGHAHAGVLLILSLVMVILLERTDFSDGLRAAVYAVAFAGGVAQSGGFFLHMLVGAPGRASRGTTLTATGAVLLAVSVLTLAVGLLSA
jgi:hypothetical protein